MKPLQTTSSQVKAVVELFIYAQGAEASSSLGIVLGNFGLNLSQFCTDFNRYSQDLPNYFLLKVRIMVFENRTFAYTVSLASLGYYLRLLAEEETRVRRRRHLLVDEKEWVISFSDFFTLFRLKFPHRAWRKSFTQSFSVVQSCQMSVRLP